MTVTVPDSRAAVVNALRILLAGRGEDFAQGATVGTRRWPGHTAEDPGLPYILVASDGVSPVLWPAAARDLIRVTVWHTGEDGAYDLAGLCLGLLTEHRGGVLRGMRPAGNLIRATDTETQTPLCSTLLTATLKPSATP